MKDAEIFISHSTEDAQFAFELREKFEAHGLKAWSYEKDLSWSEQIEASVRQEISQCDHFLLILSDAACRSVWVQRELGLAIQLQTMRKEELPTILGVMCDSPCASMQIQPRDFDTHAAFGPLYDFTRIRNFNLSSRTATEEMTDLVRELSPTVEFISRADPGEAEGELLRKSFRTYESLFPDEAESDDPADIETWIEEGCLAIEFGAPQREIYGVLHIRRIPLGMAFLTAYVNHHWAYGNYFGVRAGRRGSKRSEFCLKRIVLELQKPEVDPQMKGIIFEVEPINQALLSVVAQRGRISGFPDESAVLEQIRRLRRLNFYQRSGCFALLKADDGQPLAYKSPVLKEPLDPKGLSFILMFRLAPRIDPASVTLREIMDFVYDSLYGDAYGGSGDVEIAGYRPYVQTFRDEVEKVAATNGWKLSKARIEKSFSKLLHLAHDEGLSDSIDF